MSRPRLHRLLIGVLFLLLTACQVEVEVNLDVAEDGSGTVVVEALFDSEADTAIGGVATQLSQSGLERAGWDIVTVEDDGGGVGLTASKSVPSADQWQSVLDEIAGPDVFNDVRVTVVDEQQRLSFELDLSDGWQLFADDDVTDALDGEPFGAPIDVLTGDRAIDEIITVALAVSVTNQNDGVPETATFSPRFVDGEATQVSVLATNENSLAVLLRWIAIALFCLFVLATLLAITGIVLQRRSDRLRPTPTPATMASRVPGIEAAAAPSATPAPQQTDSVRLVIVEPLAVLYQQSHTFDQHLLPFVREHGGTARADTIADGYRSLLAGSMETAAFWELCGLDLDGATADERYIGQRSLHNGASAFFDEMQRRRIPIAATTNDAIAWSTMTRERDRLRVVWPWLISGEVGTQTRNVGMFEVLRRESGVAHSHCLYVNIDIESLDAAAELGMKTALFNTGDLDLPDVVGHPVVTEFGELFGSQAKG